MVLIPIGDLQLVNNTASMNRIHINQDLNRSLYENIDCNALVYVDTTLRVTDFCMK